jgi:nitrate/TMAO reductase-like tetraheme cytochrome c subunit
MQFDDTSPTRPLQPVSRSRVRRRTRTGSLAARIALVTAISLVAGVALFVGAAVYTDQPSFCASCHEMKPYVEAWAAGPHKDTWCVDCHVSKSLPARFAHKFASLKEVADHFSGRNTFPLSAQASVPSSNCSACHASVDPPAIAGFDHATHAAQGPCEVCHGTSGHAVSRTALSAAGALNPTVVPAVFGNSIARVGQGKADVAGHVTVMCTRCHDLAQTGCAQCHAPAHADRGACQQCHQAGPKWVFTHPAQAQCTQCHQLPSNHFKPASGDLPSCTTCHASPGKSWAFSHPQVTSGCDKCHTLPSNHFQPASGTLPPCISCHTKPGTSWKFAHPSAKADCQSCHAPPANHSAGQCSTCHHNTGVSFAFNHPSTPAPHGIAGRTCPQCHPNGYTSYTCTCHH